jgi:hypothetical protein
MIKPVLVAAVLVLLPAVADAQLKRDEAPICTDRPTKANAACTVPASRVQIESDVAGWTRADGGGARTDVVVPLNPTVKLGLDAATDIQISLAPYVRVRTRDGDGDGVERLDGVGDLVVRLKRRLTAPDAKAQVALIPFVKAPTARRGIGNREWEGGLIMPVQFALPADATLTLGPEIDLLADADGRGRHVQLAGVVNLSKALAPRVTAYAELWTAQNFDPARTVRQYSADAAVAYLLAPRLQFDLGANFGLNRATPDAQLYAGVSARL